MKNSIEKKREEINSMIDSINEESSINDIIDIINEIEGREKTIKIYNKIVTRIKSPAIVFQVYAEAKKRLVPLDLTFMENVLLKLKGTEYYNEIMYEKYCISNFARIINQINQDESKIADLMNIEELDIDEDIESYNMMVNLFPDLRYYPMILEELEQRNINCNLATYKIVLQKIIENNQVFGAEYLLEKVKEKLTEAEIKAAEEIDVNGIININYSGHFNSERISKDNMLLDNYFAINYMAALKEYSISKNAEEIINHQKLGNYYIPVIKGMLNRCIRRDQSDWMFVNRILGYTKRKDLLRDVSYLNELEIDLSYGRMMLERGQDIPKEYINTINNMAQGNFFDNLENAKKEIKKCLLDKGFEIVGDRINGRDYVKYARERKSEEELDRVKAKKVEKKYKRNINI